MITRKGSLIRRTLSRIVALLPTEANRPLQELADHEPPVRTYSPAKSRDIRSRARALYLNNALCRTIVDTISAASVDSGPALQYADRTSAPSEADDLWREFADATGFHDMIRLAITERIVTGEAFIRVIPSESPAGFTAEIIRAERVRGSAQPVRAGAGLIEFAGITYTDAGSPVSYRLHGHELGGAFAPSSHIDVPSDEMMHVWSPIEAEQKRGVSQLLPVMQLLDMIEQYSTATLDAAIMAANRPMNVFAQDSIAYDAYAKIKTVKANPSMISVWPPGGQPFTSDVRYPVANHRDYVRTLSAQACRAMGTVLNYIYDSSDLSFSAARVDMGILQDTLRRHRDWIARDIYRPVYELWYRRVYGVASPRYSLVWPRSPYVQPVQEEQARAIRINETRVSSIGAELRQMGSPIHPYDLIREQETEAAYRVAVAELAMADAKRAVGGLSSTRSGEVAA